jgi:hypothetical protein
MCKPHKNKLAGWVERNKFSTLRKLGAKRRMTRKTIINDQ